jgi:hypothetical protein
MRVTYENGCQARAPSSLIRFPPSVFVDDESVTSAGSLARDEMGHRSRNQALRIWLQKKVSGTVFR